MTELDTYDLHWAVHRLPHRVRDLMKDHGQNIVAAGGFVRSLILGEPPNDLDLFVPQASLAKTFATLLAEGEPVVETVNAYTVRPANGLKFPVQFIHRWTYPVPVDLLGSFDFTIACAAFWFDETWKSLVHPKFYSDLAAKRLIYLHPEREEEPGGSLLRVLKFTGRGFKIPMDSLSGVLTRLYSGISNSPTVDVGLALKRRLRDVDPLVDPEHIFHLAEPE